MALNPTSMANEIVASIQNLKSPVEVSQKIGEAISNYLCNNTSVYFTWAGIMPPAFPDPIITATSSKLIGTFSCVPTMATNPAVHGLLLGQQIQAGISTLLVAPPPTFLIPPATFAAIAPIILTPTNMKDPVKHWTVWATTIITTFKTYINPTPLPGSHLAFIGSPGAIMTLIS